jgi:predicted CXXCH cytochrome family protein
MFRGGRRLAGLLGLGLLALSLSAADDAAKIMRPSDGSALSAGPIDVAAMAPQGRLELDGKPIEAEEPFPNVLHARVNAGPGEHTLALLWERGRKEVRVYVGENPPAGFAAFYMHPPPDGIDCAQCHGLSRRGRFRFQGNCFRCHTDAQFTAKHPHPKHVLEQCGMCHNAHGSTAASLMLYPRETACRQCHSL